MCIPQVPKNVRSRHQHALSYYEEHGTSIFRSLLHQLYHNTSTPSPSGAGSENNHHNTIKNGGNHSERIIVENSKFVAVIPFAALSPFNVWIIPTYEPSAHFERTSFPQKKHIKTLYWHKNGPIFQMILKDMLA